MTNPEVHGDPKLLYDDCVALSASHQWDAILKLLQNDKLHLSFPRLLIFKLDAAVALNNLPAVKQMAEDAAAIEGYPKETFALIREINRHGFNDMAAKLLLAREDLADDPQFLQAVKRLLKTSRDIELRRLLNDAYAKASRFGEAIKPKKSEFTYPPRQFTVARGLVKIANSSFVSNQHISRLQDDTQSFIARIANPKNARIEEFSDVFVDRYGQIWDENGAIIRSLGEAIPNVSRRDVPEIAIGIHGMSKTRGIYHFLVDRIPFFAWMIDNPSASEIPILLRDNAPAFEQELLSLAGFPNSQIYEVGDAVFVRRLIVARCGFEGMVGWGHIAPIMNKIVESSVNLADMHNVELPEKIYISRAAAVRRSMTNEDVLECEMLKRQVAVYQFEHKPLWQQIAVAHNAKTIVAPHGAGLSHPMLAPAGTKVIEILPIAAGTYQLRWNYARLSLLKGHEYVAWLEEQPLPVSDKWSTSLDEFLPFLDECLAH